MLKTYLVEVLVQHPINALDRPFTYLIDSVSPVLVGVRVRIDFHQQKLVGYIVSVKETVETKSELETRLGFSINYLTEIIDEYPILNDELVDLCEQVASYYYAPRISVLHAMLPPSLQPSRASLKKPGLAFDQYVEISANSDVSFLTTRQQNAFQTLMTKGLLKKSQISPTLFEKLSQHGLVHLVKVPKSRLKLPDIASESAPVLTVEQTNAVNAIYYGDLSTYLLEGVTGSGKTEVYLKLAEKYMEQGKNVLFLVPEIALTPMMVKYFLSRFDQKVALFHSELTPAQKYDEYRRIANHEVSIVVGARSAIFVPLSNIGLIVIDEEHSGTYKQDTLPFYHAISVAEMRAKTFNAKIVLGSATPSLETRTRAIKGIYGHVFLNTRINRQQLPSTTIVDMLNIKNISAKSIYFSKMLISALEETLTKNEQAILLVNRRGYASFVSCRKCGYVAKCPDCGLSLAYHRHDHKLRCHHCGFSTAMIDQCPDCQDTHLKTSGFGTQRAVDALQSIFPQARILRLDSDVAKEKVNLTKVLGQFSDHQADILIGTQMVAKGHDFPLVTLVGVINADVGLAIPSFRASENTFQLITQAVGRSGRANLSGRAIIQTTLPNHYAIVDASKGDYHKFYLTEMNYRRLSKNPPYTYLMQITISSANEEKLEDTVITLKETMISTLGSDVTVIGPAVPYFQIIKTIYERTLIVKYTNYFRIKPKMYMVLKPLMENSGFKVKINIDPFDI